LVPPIGAVLIVDQASRSALLNHFTNTEVPTARIWGMGPRSCCHDRPFRSTSVLGSGHRHDSRRRQLLHDGEDKIKRLCRRAIQATLIEREGAGFRVKARNIGCLDEPARVQ
jgi:hypothetical protein